MSGAKSCPACGQANSPDARFCGRCGGAMTSGAPSTLLAGSLDQLPGAPPQVQQPAPTHAAPAQPQKAMQKTMLGVDLRPPTGYQPQPHAASADDVSSTQPTGSPGPAVAERGVSDRTLIDQPLVPPAEARGPMRTMLGVSAIDPSALPASPFATNPGTAGPPIGAVQSAFASHPPPQPVSPQAAFPAGQPQPQQPAHPQQAAYPQPQQPAPLAPPQPAYAPEPAQPHVAQPHVAQPHHAPPHHAPPHHAPPHHAPPHHAVPAAFEPTAQMPATDPASLAAPQPAAPFAAPQALEQPAAVAKPKMPQRTMLGMPAMDAQALADAAEQARLNARPKPTEQGMPAAPREAPAPAPVAPAAQEAPKKKLGPSNRTMLGVAVQAPAAQAQAAIAAQAAQPQGMPAPMPGTPNAYGSPGPDDVSIAGLPSPAKRGRGLLVGVLVLGLMLVGGVAAVLLWYRFGRAPGIRVAVASGAEGETLSVDLPGAAPGTHVRFGGQDRELSATGHAELPLALDALHVGDNQLAIEVVAPGGAVDTRTVTLTVELRVRADLASLNAEPPAITVVVEALPGSTAVLDGTPLALDAAGHATRSYPLDGIAAPPAEGDTSAVPIVHTVAYTITPPGQAPATGTLTTRVPRTVMQIDRPGDELVTDRDSVEIAGAVTPGASVRIDGTDVPVTDGRFLFRFALPSPGEFRPTIVARAPGRAPASRQVHVRRVADLAAEAATFTYDRTITYARLATGPAQYTGQRVAFEGNVYNVDVQGGRSVLQMRARECPRGSQCLLWVTYPAATDVTPDSWVRVLGTVAGEQQFRTESGSVRTVPRIDATYVLPARP